MLFSKRMTSEDRVVDILLQRPSTMKQLHGEISTTGDPVTIRAVYKIVKGLLDAEVLIKVGKRLWVNQQWVRSLREHLLPSLPPLISGEKVVYTFNSLKHLDVFWKTIAFQFEDYERDGQIFFYNPHNFWAYIPELKESEYAYYVHFAKVKKSAFFTVGDVTTADKEFKRSHQNEFLQIDTRVIANFGQRDHVTVLGDHIITAQLSSALAKQIDDLYASGESIEKILPKILIAYNKNAKVKLILENNAPKASKLRKSLSANFYIPSTI